MKALLIIVDGLGGRPTDWGDVTCLERAWTPNLDRLTARGALGLMDPIAPGVRPGSDTSHLALFGYNPREVYPGRGVFEALGIGIDVQEGDVCFRANFATVEPGDQGPIVVDRRAGRLAEGQELAEGLNEIELPDGIQFTFRASTEHRGALVLRGPGLSGGVTENDPHETGLPIPEIEATADTAEAARTARALNAFVEGAIRILDAHPVNKRRVSEGQPPGNAVLLRGPAMMPDLPSISGLYGIRGACVAGGALYKGVARAAGLEVLVVPGATGDLETNLHAKASAAADALADHELVFVHIKGADNAGHDGDAAAKTAFLERIDHEFLGDLLTRLPDRDYHLCLSGDHTTPPATGEHTADPVPVLFFGPAVRVDRTTTFGERSAGEGGLGRFSGHLLPQLLGYCDLGGKYGA